MKKLRRALTTLLVATLALGAAAGQQLSIRLVEASQQGGSSSPELADVTAILSRNLPFANFTLQGSRKISLPAEQAVVQIGGYSLTCNGSQQDLQLAIRRGGRVLVSTILRLTDGTPVIVGGFSSANGKQIFVLVAQ